MLPEKKRDTNIQALAIVMVVILVAIVFIMIEFCEGWGLRQLSQDLFSPRAPVSGLSVVPSDRLRAESHESHESLN